MRTVDLGNNVLAKTDLKGAFAGDVMIEMGSKSAGSRVYLDRESIIKLYKFVVEGEKEITGGEETEAATT